MPFLAKRSVFLLACAVLAAQERPLTKLPYTPSLDSSFMDKSADPCVDFYKYACGGWNKLNPMPADQARWGVYSKIEEENERFLWGVLEQAAYSTAARNENEQKIGDYFGACMNEAAIESAGAKPLDEPLARIAALQSQEDLAGYVATQQRLGQNLLFNFGSEPDYDNSARMMAAAGAGGLGLPDRDYYTKTDAKSQEIRQKYVAHVAQMLATLGESSVDAQSDAKAVMEIETGLAQASLTQVERRDPYNLKHKLTTEDLQQLTPAFDWDKYFVALRAPEFTQLNVSQPKFYKRLNKELQDVNVASWRAYLRWHLVHTEASRLARKFEEPEFDFYQRYLRGVKEMPQRWKKCTRLVDEQLGDALGRVFVAKTFAPQTKDDAARMTKQIEDEMERDIKDLEWMSPATKQQALNKLRGIVNKVGYPDKWRDYSTVKIAADDFAGNAERAREFAWRAT